MAKFNLTLPGHDKAPCRQRILGVYVEPSVDGHGRVVCVVEQEDVARALEARGWRRMKKKGRRE